MKSKHFAQLARSLARTRPPTSSALVRLEQWQADCDAIADALASMATEQCRFDKGRWCDALEREVHNGLE